MFDGRDTIVMFDKLAYEDLLSVLWRPQSAPVPDLQAQVIQQLEDLKRWKRRHGYGMRWMAESAFSSIKRTFGEHVSSIKWNKMVNELMFKASIYNLFMDKMTT